MLARCTHVVKIPTKFSINVGMAGAITLYDRLLTHGRFAERPLRAGGPSAHAQVPADLELGRAPDPQSQGKGLSVQIVALIMR